MKMNMDVTKCENDNASAAPLRFQIFENFENFEKMKIWKISNFKIHMKRIWWNDEALYESPVRKLG